ncbi:MAG: hypothetical protein IAE90_13460 [Ignavibacteria bacterium]|nr:hypothetical protein [Ignavibacteria bacterium]
MKTSGKTLISVLSWEDRFIRGLMVDLSTTSYKNFFLLSHEGRDKLKEKNYREVKKIINEKKINFEFIKMPNDRAKRWKLLEEKFFDEDITSKNVTLDITTMRRETIWTLLSFFNSKKKNIAYTYYQPDYYNEFWLSREPDIPQLLFKHSGITKFSKKSALLIITGFDTERTRQLVNHYEPEVVLLGVQRGKQFDNNARNNFKLHKDVCKGQTTVKTFYLDAYSEDHGFKSINSALNKIKRYNVIATSQGPKLSAISLYKSFLQNTEIAMCYVPAKQYNKDYSKGIGNVFKGKF